LRQVAFGGGQSQKETGADARLMTFISAPVRLFLAFDGSLLALFKALFAALAAPFDFLLTNASHVSSF
jgi:hypothetical protein